MKQLDILVTKEEYEPYYPIAKAILDKSDGFTRFIAPYILEAQESDIKPVLGNAFWTDLVANKSNDLYALILEGGEYTDANNNTCTFMGLKASIIYFSLGRYITGKNAVDTAFGMVSKTNEYSQPVSSKVIAESANSKTSMGIEYLSQVQKYLCLKATDYPLYKIGSTQEVGKGKSRISGVSRFESMDY